MSRADGVRPLEEHCPVEHCKAQPGHRCQSKEGRADMRNSHPARVSLAIARRQAEVDAAQAKNSEEGAL